MTKFAGLCVGGPYAGKQIVEMSGVLKVEVELRPKRLRPGNGQSPVVNFKTHIYRSQMIGTVGVWIHESLTLDEAVQTMASGYIAARKQADIRATAAFSG